LWVAASDAPTGPRIYAIDIGAGQAGFYGVMKERGRPLIIALRLKVVNGQITEIEHVLARTVREDALRHLMTPRPEFAADVTPVDSLPLGGATSNLQAGEIFKIDRGGQITAIEAMGAQLPYGTPSGWGE